MSKHWTHSRDKNGGARDVYLGGKIVIEDCLSSDAIRIVDAANAAMVVLDAELDDWKRRALAAEAAVKASNHPFVCPCGRVVTLTTEAQP